MGAYPEPPLVSVTEEMEPTPSMVHVAVAEIDDGLFVGGASKTILGAFE